MQVGSKKIDILVYFLYHLLMKKLTIGSAVYDDFDGVYFSYQSLRLNNQDIWDELDLIIIDNNPESAQGRNTKSFCKKTRGIRYIPYTKKKSTSVRNEIFKNAEGEFCMSIDCHVLFESGTIKKLIKHFEENPNTKDLFHGPMLYDVINGHDPCTHMEPVWRDAMYGTWGNDQRGNDPNGSPFEIPMHGLGIFACKTDEWLGFNEKFEGFGGEEGYIHKKYKKAGRKTWCLPFLRWLHRFDRPSGVNYPLNIEQRIRNYIHGHKELGLPYDDIVEHFGQKSINVNQIIKDVEEGKPYENKNSKVFDADSIELWEESKIQFNAKTKIRYIKYEILDSYDGFTSLREIKFYPVVKNPGIILCNSQDDEHNIDNILTPNGYWQSNKNDNFKFPHYFIIDLREEYYLNSITAFPKASIRPGIPKKFNVYASSNGEDWKIISEVDIEE